MMKSLIFHAFSIILLQLTAEAAPPGALTKHLSSLIKWTRTPPKLPQSDGNILQFENGYLVDTVVEQGNHLGVEPYSIRVTPEGELFAVDAINNNIVRITPPLSQYSRARLVAGSFQGYSGHVDGKPSDARFNHPKGVAIDDNGNVYVADTSNLSIRKIGESGVTTIAGGKSNAAGYRDGPSEDAKFSNDFDVVYVPRTCSLLVVDRGNAALRQISLQQEDCDDQHSSISTSDIIMVVGAVLVGYTSCVLQQGFGSSFFSKKKEVPENEFQDQPTNEKPTLVVETLKEDPDAGWPSFSRLIIDLLKLAFEALGNIFLYFIPLSLKPKRFKKGLTPLKDTLVIPEDKSEPSLVQNQRSSSPITKTLHAPNTSNSHTQQKPLKGKHSKDPALSGKHRSSKRQDFSEFYGSGDSPQYGQFSSKSQKDRTRHRHRDKSGEMVFGAAGGHRDKSGEVVFGAAGGHRDKSGEVVFGATGLEPKPAEIKSIDYTGTKFDHYNIRGKFGTDDHFRF